jgi:hypothetical protein
MIIKFAPLGRLLAVGVSGRAGVRENAILLSGVWRVGVKDVKSVCTLDV